MEKTRDLFKKIGDTKGTFHSKMGTLESRNARTLQKQKRWQEYTEKVLMTRIVVWHSPRARHPEVQSQVGLGKHHYEQS